MSFIQNVNIVADHIADLLNLNSTFTNETINDLKTLRAEVSANATTVAINTALVVDAVNAFTNASIGSVITGDAGTNAEVTYDQSTGKFDFVIPKGDKGERGSGITNVVFTSTTDPSGYAGQAEAIDTYTINFDDGSTTTFVVKNGGSNQASGLPYKNQLYTEEHFALAGDFGSIVPDRFEIRPGGILEIADNAVFMVVKGESL